jgi:hypothetical protein
MEKLFFVHVVIVTSENQIIREIFGLTPAQNMFSGRYGETTRPAYGMDLCSATLCGVGTIWDVDVDGFVRDFITSPAGIGTKGSILRSGSIGI